MAFRVRHSPVEGTNNPAFPVSKNQWNADLTATQVAGRLLGRTTSGEGAVEEITVGSGLALSSGTLYATGGGGGGGGGAFPDPSEFTALVEAAFTADTVLNWLGGDVVLDDPILLQATEGKFNFGIRGNGARVTSNFSDSGQAAITIEIPIVGSEVVQNVNVRNFTIADIHFRGSSAFAGGLMFRCLSNGSWINSFSVLDCTCEGHSGYAYQMIGSVFEWVGDRLKSTGGVGGIWIERKGAPGSEDRGLPSAMKLIDPNFRDCSGNGIELACEVAYTEPHDLTIIGGYLVTIEGIAVKAPAGITMVDNVGVEAINGGCGFEVGYRGGIFKGNTRGANPYADSDLESGMGFLIFWWGGSGTLVVEDCAYTDEGSGSGMLLLKAQSGTIFMNRSGDPAVVAPDVGTATIIRQDEP